MTLQLCTLNGDGIGPEIVPVSKRAINATNIDVDWRQLPIGWATYEENGSSAPKQTVDTLEKSDGWILGPTLAGEYPDDDLAELSPSGTIRSRFDLYANIRTIRSYHGIGPNEVDITFFRQNTEGFYADRNMFAGDGQFMPTKDVAASIRIVTRSESRRIAQAAFNSAAANNQAITAVHKANVLSQGDGLFLEECQRVSNRYPEVSFDTELVDAFAMKLVTAPTDIDVVLTTNMYGDILSDEAAGIVGSLGLMPSLNAGDEYAMAQAAHGAAPDIAGENIANPVAIVLSAAMLLEWLGRRGTDEVTEAAEVIKNAVEETINDGVRTPDIGGDATTNEVGDAIVERIRQTTSQ